MPPHRSFRAVPDTRWSSVLADPSRDLEHWKHRFGELFLDYQGPVSNWLAAAGLGRHENVEDLCQGFFLRLIERDVLTAFDPARGRLRAFLKGALRNFARERRRYWRARRRDAVVTEIDGHEPCAADEAGPDAAFDRAFAATMIGKALALLDADCAAGDRQVDLALFRAYDVDGTVDSYEEAAQRFGRNRDWVKNHLTAMRERFHATLLATLREATTNPSDAVATLREIVRA
ncbi:MAG: hypothetical protein HZB39_09730 [Planctomycetes bacterium]|nr:hypothetical protein [Planctomycetota bacterium]